MNPEDKHIWTKTEHDLFVQRVSAEHESFSHRLDVAERRLDKTEEKTQEIFAISSEVRRLAESIAKLTDKMEIIESRDGQMWRNVVGWAISAVIGIVIGFLLRQLGI